MKHKDIQKIEVRMWDKLVGELAIDESGFKIIQEVIESLSNWEEYEVKEEYQEHVQSIIQENIQRLKQ